jgi:uncharacterized protein
MIIIQGVNRSTYRPRALTATLEQALKDHPVVVLTGARQTGKTTLAVNLPSAPTRVFRTLDDLNVLDLAKRRPDDLLAQGGRLTLDEVPRAPELLLAVKRDVDRRRRRGRFLLTGSANLLLMRQVADSLSGRAVYLQLMPMTAGEKEGSGQTPPWSEVFMAKRPSELLDLASRSQHRRRDWVREALQGGMPPAVRARSARERIAWFEGYLRTYLERDLRDFSAVESLPDFRRLMGLAAQRLGQLLNQTEIGRDAALSQATAHRYLNLLEVSFQTHRLPAFASSRSQRLIKTPKLYWMDTGLASHLAGITDRAELARSRLRGALLENLVLSGVAAWRECWVPRPQVSYWRTAAGLEVDLVIEHGRTLLPVEIKASTQVRPHDTHGLEAFLGKYRGRAPIGLLLYDGAQALLGRSIAALPVSLFI